VYRRAADFEVVCVQLSAERGTVFPTEAADTLLADAVLRHVGPAEAVQVSCRRIGRPPGNRIRSNIDAEFDSVPVRKNRAVGEFRCLETNGRLQRSRNQDCRVSAMIPVDSHHLSFYFSSPYCVDFQISITCDAFCETRKYTG